MMESLKDTSWDVILSGTGLPQSLLALALSRSGKKVLHVDKNEYYGGSEAALSLQEAEAWVEAINNVPTRGPYRHASIHKPQNEHATKLGFPRAYSLSLAPQLIYSRSNLLPALVSSKVYRQLEFLAVGSWYIYKDSQRGAQNPAGDVLSPPPLSGGQDGELYKIPGGREDIFADKSIDHRSARSLMKFLKAAADVDAHSEILSEWGSKPVSEYLSLQVGIPSKLQSLLLALTLSPSAPADTTIAFALPRIHRHLTSIGMFGSGFGSVVPKWGGLAEIAQVACRAGAVGGGVYVLHRAVESISETTSIERSVEADASTTETTSPIPRLEIRLDNNEKIHSHWIVGTRDHLPPSPTTHVTDEASLSPPPIWVQRRILVVSSPLSELFPPQVEGSPSLDVAVISFPAGSIDQHPLHPPVYLMVHTSATGECPTGQCIVYAHTTVHSPTTDYSSLLSQVTETFLSSIHETPKPEVLWSLDYQQRNAEHSISGANNDHIICLSDVTPGLVLEDDVLRNVREAWERIVVEDTGDRFMTFQDREGVEEDDEPGAE